MLVVSDPPHGDVKDEAAAAVLGVPVDHARLKIGFGAPEVLVASNPDRAADVRASLKAAGVNVEMRDGDALARLPWPTLVSSFELGHAGLSAPAGDEVVEIAYDEPVFGVYCGPPSDFSPPPGAPEDGMVRTGPAAADALEWVPHLDLYYVRGGLPARISIAAKDVRATVEACRRRFANLALDTRLGGVRPRRRFVAGELGFDPDMRKRYAFGTLLLRNLLESISSELRDVTQYELGSRLAYVLSQEGPES
jgi:hypothetical protein